MFAQHHRTQETFAFYITVKVKGIWYQF